MNGNGSPILGFLGFWMLLPLAALLALLLGGMYALYCLGRAATGLERLATAMEQWVSYQSRTNTSHTSPLMPGGPPTTRMPSIEVPMTPPQPRYPPAAPPVPPPIPESRPEPGVIPPAQPPPDAPL